MLRDNVMLVLIILGLIVLVMALRSFRRDRRWLDEHVERLPVADEADGDYLRLVQPWDGPRPWSVDDHSCGQCLGEGCAECNGTGRCPACFARWAA